MFDIDDNIYNVNLAADVIHGIWYNNMPGVLELAKADARSLKVMEKERFGDMAHLDDTKMNSDHNLMITEGMEAVKRKSRPHVEAAAH